MKEYKYKINGNTYKVAVGDIDNNVAQVEVNGIPYKVEIDAPQKPVTIVNAPRPAAAPRTESGAKVIAKPAATGSGHQVKAPLPGTVLSVAVKVGDTVKASDTVLVLEAMKMENAIHAGRDGKVASISVSPGDAVLEGALLITLE
ncbi:MAG: acetyl-CoA carboxylase biotin carboxyl carrier protein subunit [Barnesiella sp.]|nr:acetyl-CoA carboxylase biotin carboxyl carrier protein subunit [Barnesiella sp.]MBD5331023.1 acetyl-CoA carboxylase biotin carboxyl carrier protein subunit [Bacteroides sp.]MBD5375279.1 acetyl-CoA carboxylase biotin carboxyl carrier protein subunit [Bacteroides sp.]MDE7460985.1 acetyl-CoA carboxylase biotin carboxyl carrier protein subunit [Paramuribaculum sp.]